MLTVRNLSVSYGELTILNNVSFDLTPGEWLMIVGPNGAGKSTLINAIVGGAPARGSVRFEGREIRSMKPQQVARSIGVLAQSHAVGYSFTVEEVVRLGRYSHAPGIFSRHSDADEESVERALELTGIRELLHQSVLTLSGGELQRAFLAQLFVQAPKLLMLDEPTNHLDLVYQKQVFQLVRKWMDDTGGAVVSVVHDLSLARMYGTHAVLLSQGKMVTSGPIGSAFDPAVIDKVYSMDVKAWMNELFSQWQ